MTVRPTSTETTYLLEGTNVGPFGTVWPYGAARDVQVYLSLGTSPRLLASGSEYTLTGPTPLQTGGAVTLNSTLPGVGWPDGALLILSRATADGQPSAFGEVNTFSPRSAEDALDNLARQMQEFKTRLPHALTKFAGVIDAGASRLINLVDAAGSQDAVTLAQLVAAASAFVVGRLVNFPTFANRVGAQVAHIDGAVNTVLLLGYGANGDGGRSFYKRVVAQPAHQGKFQDADGAWWEIAELVLDAEMLGAGTTADDTSAIVNALGIGHHVRADGTYVTSGSVTLGQGDVLEGAAGEITANGAADNLILGGDRAKVAGIRLITTASDQAVSSSSLVSDGGLEDVIIDASGSAGVGNAVVIAGAGQTGMSFRGIRLAAKAYGFLLNATDAAAAAVQRILIQGFDITAGTGDPIAFNSPGKAAQNVVVAGGLLTSTAGAGNGGLGISFARVQGFVAANFIVTQATFEGLHIENGSRHGVVNGFVVRTAGRTGVYHSIEGTHAADALPIAVSAFSIQGAATKAAAVVDSVGYWATNTTSGVQTRSPVGIGYLHGFQYGVWASGPGLHAFDALSVAECNYVLKVGGNNRTGTVAPGRYYAKTIDAFVYVNAGAGYDLGEFHIEGQLPSTFVTYAAGAPSPGAMIRGFSGHIPDCLLAVGAGNNFADLFPEPRRMHGRLTIWLDDGSGFGFMWDATVTYDGTTFTVTDPIREGTANFAISLTPTLQVVGGMVQITIFNGGGAGAYTAHGFVRFQGSYYA